MAHMFDRLLQVLLWAEKPPIVSSDFTLCRPRGLGQGPAGIPSARVTAKRDRRLGTMQGGSREHDAQRRWRWGR